MVASRACPRLRNHYPVRREKCSNAKCTPAASGSHDVLCVAPRRRELLVVEAQQPAQDSRLQQDARSLHTRCTSLRGSRITAAVRHFH